MTNVDKKGMYPNLKAKRKRLAEDLCNPDFIGMSITELCEKHDISRQTFYNWQNDAEFKGYVSWLVDSYTDSELPNAWKQLIKKVNSGCMDAITMLFKIKGVLKDELNLTGKGVGVTIINNIGEKDE